jgi:hypothetical protein
MSQSKFMKFPLPAFILSGSVLIAGCNSLDNPLGGFLGSGHDARVYNSQTGQFEWPKEEQKKKKSGSDAVVAAMGTPAPHQSDGRYFDAQKNEWVEVREERSAAVKPKKPAAPTPVLMTTPVPVGTPPPVRPPRARGVYNASTGQIEWTDFNPAPSATPVPEKKKWYWPF